MKKSYLMQFKRRRENKTNYRKRMALLKSDKTRLVIRRSLSNITVQFVNFVPKGDETIASATSAELKKARLEQNRKCSSILFDRIACWEEG